MQTNSENVLQHPWLRDAQIVGLSINDKDLAIQMRSSAGKDFEIRLNGMTHLQASEFRMSNRVHRIFALSKVDAMVELRSNQNDLGLAAADLKPVGEAIQNGERVLFQIDADAGCHIVSVCRSLDIV